MTNRIGRRYRCNTCQSEFIVTKGGDGELECCSEPMDLVSTDRPGQTGTQASDRDAEIEQGSGQEGR